MNHHYHLTGCCGIFLLLFLPHIAVADEVRLNNGDRLTGEIISMEKNLLILRSEFIQEKLSIELKDIACIISERKLPAVFQNEELVIGTLSCPENGMIAIDSANLGKLPPLSLDRLQSINPSTYSGLFNLGGDLNSGNSNTNTVKFGTKFQVRTHKAPLYSGYRTPLWRC